MSSYWAPVLIVAAVTFLFRYSCLGGKLVSGFPPLLKLCLEYVPVSIMATMVALGFFIGEDKSFILSPPHLASALVAMLAAIYLKKDLITILLGLVTFALVDYYF